MEETRSGVDTNFLIASKDSWIPGAVIWPDREGVYLTFPSVQVSIPGSRSQQSLLLIRQQLQHLPFYERHEDRDVIGKESNNCIVVECRGQIINVEQQE